MSMHERMESLADLYAAGGLSPDERREADGHAGSCGACATLLREATDFRGWVTGALAPDAPPADLEERIVARLRASSAVKTKRWRFLPGRRLLKVLGGVAAAAGLIFFGNAFAQVDGGASRLISQLDQATEAYQTDWGGYTALPSAGSAGAKGWNYWGKDRLEDGTNPSFAVEGGRVHAYGYNRGTVDGKFESRNSYDRDVSSLREYNAALERDNAKMRPKAEAGDHFYRSWGSALSSESNHVRLGAPSAVPPERALALVDGSETEKLAKLEADMQVAVRQVEVQLAQQKELATKAVEQRAKLNSFPGVDAATAAVELKPEAPQEGRKIIRTADVDLEVESYDAAATKLAAMASEEKGYIAGANTQRLPNGKIRAVVTLRVPPERFEALIAKLKDLGTVRSQNVGSQDVSKAYVDMEIRLGSKQALLERLKLLLKEAKGTVKELLEVEVQMGKTIEEIESIKGELKFFDNQVSLSTLTLTISEKDLGRPFEYVQTLQSNIGLTARNADDVYAKAQKEITDAGGQVVDSKMNRQNDGSATGTIRGRVDAEKFPTLREALKKLGRVTNDTVNQQKTARGGHEGAVKPDAPLKKEQAVIDLTIATPPVAVTRRAQLLIETPTVQDGYPAARQAIEAADGKIQSGSLQGRGNGTRANVSALVDVEKFAALVEKLKAMGKLKDSTVQIDTPAATADGAPPLLREQAQIDFFLVSPPELIGEEHGIGKTIRDTFSGSWKGLLWSLEKLFVGISLAGPWLGLAALGWLAWRRFRRKKPAVG